MHPKKNSLSIRLTEPVVPLRSTLERASRHHDSEREILPLAIVRGLLTIKLAKPTKVSSIELRLQAKATTRYAQGAGPNRADVIEQYNVHSASTVVFKAGPVSQDRRRALSTRPRVQFLDDHAGSSTRHGMHVSGVGSGHWQAPLGPYSVARRSASLDPLSPRVRRQPSSDDLEIYDDRSPQRSHMSIDPAPPYSLSVDSNVASRSQSVASSSRIAGLQSSPIPSRSSVTPDIPYGSSESSVRSICGISLSCASSIDEASENRSEDFDTSVMRSDHDSVGYYGLSRITSGSSGHRSERDHRGRSHSRFSFEKVVHVFEAVKDRVRSRSPRAASRPQARSDEQEGRGRSLTKGKGQAQITTHGLRDALPQISVAEPSVADGANDQSGDGWVVFPEGTYTYPVFFTIPNNSPPTMKADHGSLIWKVKAEFKCPSVFKSKMTAQKEVIVICAPREDHSEEEEGIDLQRQWDGQLQYRVQIAGRDVPVGGKIPFQVTLMPLAKVKVHSILVYLDERTEYYTRAHSRARSDAIRRATLLVIKHNDSDARHSEPILPLVSDKPDVFCRSPLYRFLRPGEDESEVASSFTGPGPWTVSYQLKVPDSCSILHPSNRTKGSNVVVNHTLKLVLRVEKEEDMVAAGRKKLYDIMIHVPIQILSCRCTLEWASLPRYDGAPRPEGNPLGDISTCPCCTRRQAKARTHTHAPDTLTTPPEHDTPPPTREALDIFLSDSLANRTHLHEQLISGLMSERGEAPSSYERFGAV